jgi:hypothetical protein
MSTTLQTVIALLLVAGAFLFFIGKWWLGRKKTGCGGGCGCHSTRKIKGAKGG